MSEPDHRRVLSLRAAENESLLFEPQQGVCLHAEMIICSGHGRKPHDEFIPFFNVHPIKPSKRLNVIWPRRTANSRNRAKNKLSFGEGSLKELHKRDKTNMINGIRESFCRVETVTGIICIENQQWPLSFYTGNQAVIVDGKWKLFLGIDRHIVDAVKESPTGCWRHFPVNHRLI